MNQYGFFPLTAEEIEGFWCCSTDAEKLYFYLLKSEFNYLQSGSFRRSDAWFAAAIGCSVSAIRLARRRLQSIGLLDFEPGWRKAGRGLAGHYKSVHGVNVVDGVFWAKVGFYKLHMLLACLRQKSLTRESVVLMLLLDFYRRKFEVTQENNFFLTKNQIRKRNENGMKPTEFFNGKSLVKGLMFFGCFDRGDREKPSLYNSRSN